MKNISARLTKIEGDAVRLGLGRCPVCRGHLYVIGLAKVVPMPGGGFEQVVNWQADPRTTSDLRCQSCGSPAEKIVITTPLNTMPVRPFGGLS
jgi:hypothetical protein